MESKYHQTFKKFNQAVLQAQPEIKSIFKELPTHKDSSVKVQSEFLLKNLDYLYNHYVFLAEQLTDLSNEMITRIEYHIENLQENEIEIKENLLSFKEMINESVLCLKKERDQLFEYKIYLYNELTLDRMVGTYPKKEKLWLFETYSRIFNSLKKMFVHHQKDFITKYIIIRSDWSRHGYRAYLIHKNIKKEENHNG